MQPHDDEFHIKPAIDTILSHLGDRPMPWKVTARSLKANEPVQRILLHPEAKIVDLQSGVWPVLICLEPTAPDPLKQERSFVMVRPGTIVHEKAVYLGTFKTKDGIFLMLEQPID